jgi:DNA modification methylase
MQFLRQIEEGSVDLIFADPPYMIMNKAGFRAVDGRHVGSWNIDSYSDYHNFTFEWLRECKRILSPLGSIWVIGDYNTILILGDCLLAQEYHIVNQVVWVKANPTPQWIGKRLSQSTECLIWASKTNKYYFDYWLAKAMNQGKQMRTDWYFPVCRGKERKNHPHQKPLVLLERIVEICSIAGNLILDPFVGSGTTMVAAKRLGRRYVGCDIDSKSIYIANERIESLT